MQINNSHQTRIYRSVKPKQAPKAEAEAGLVQRTAGQIRGVVQSAVLTLPGAYTGYKVGKKTAEWDTLSKVSSFQGAAVLGAIGYAVGGGIGAGVGTVIGGMVGLAATDLIIGEESKRIQERVESALQKHPEPRNVREKTAYNVRAALVGAIASQEVAFESGRQIGEGKILGLTRGLARIPEVLRQDNSQGLEPIDATPRSVLKQVVGAPLGLANSVGSTLAGGLAGMSRYGGIGHGLLASTILGSAATAAAALLGAPAVAVGVIGTIAAAAPALSLAVAGTSFLINHQTSQAERYSVRQDNDRAQAPKFKDFETTLDDVANRRQFRIEGFTAGLVNGSVSGFEAGSRLSDPIINGAETLGKKVVETVKNIPEKLGGIWDAITNPEGKS